MIRKLPGVLLLALHTSLALGQAKPASSDAWQSVFFESPDTALPLLTAAAIRHSAELRGMEIDKSINQQDIKLAKKSIIGSFGLGANYSYGNLASISLSDPSNPNQFTTYSSARYSSGITFSLPLDRVVSRGNLIRKEELSFQRTEAQRQERENLLRQQLITLYQNVRLARKVLTLQQEAYVTTRTSYQLAEKQFRQGQMTLPELSDVNTQLTGVTIAQESARSQYDTAFMLLEEVVGAKISTLMTKR